MPRNTHSAETVAASNHRQRQVLYFVIVVLVVVIISHLFAWVLGNDKDESGNFYETHKPVEINPEQYYAVFLSNDQVYFSKIMTNLDQEYVRLEDIYYVRVQRSLQGSNVEDRPTQQQTSISLVKLGNELHGPEDTMIVNNSHVLFIEPLKADSEVVKAIEDEKRSNEEE